MHFELLRDMFGFLSRKSSTRSLRKESKTSRPAPRRSDTSSSCGSFKSASSTPSSASEESIQSFARDPQYYPETCPESDGAFCVLQAQQTLFKVEKAILMRDNSSFCQAFATLKSPSDPLKLSDSASSLRDLLHVLHSLPVASDDGSDLLMLPHLPLDLSNPSSVIHIIPHLLNVAELSSKYCFKSFERWAVLHIQKVLDSGAFWVPREGFRFGSTPSSLNLNLSAMESKSISAPKIEDDENLDPDTLISRIILLSLHGPHPDLTTTMTQKLISRVLWHSYVPGPRLTEVLETHGAKGGHESMRRLRAVTEYRALVDLPTRVVFKGRRMEGRQHPIFPEDMKVETRMRYLAAHHVLSGVWDKLRREAPPLPCSELPADSEASCEHDECVEAWGNIWKVISRAVDSASPYHQGHPSNANDAAVLGKLKSMVLLFRKITTADESRMCLECSLGALETLALIRDSTIQTLCDMFEYC